MSCRGRTWVGAWGMGALVALASGCGLLRRPAPQLPAIVVAQAPILLADGAAERAPMPPPQVLTPLTDPPPLLADAGAPPLIGPPPPAPRRSDSAGDRREESPPAPTSALASTPPQLSPGLSPQQQAAYRRSVLALLRQTQNDLKQLYGRNLAGEAAATRSQASEYVRQAQQALSDGDMLRAQTLAAKAQTLAQFLLGR